MDGIMISRSFHAIPINTADIRNHLFFTVLWAGLWVFSSGCGVHQPTHTGQSGCEPVSQIIHFYQGPLDHLSAVRDGGCPMTPHCSAYALTAVEQHGPLLGLVMTFDRLIRCGNDEIHLSPEVFVNGRRRTYDPVEANEWNPKTPLQENREWEILIE